MFFWENILFHWVKVLRSYEENDAFIISGLEEHFFEAAGTY